jgi:hypothetical protein
MQAKNVLYAAVGAPVVAARKVTEQVNALKGRVSEETTSYGEMASKAIDEWATEGEKVVSRISEGKVVEEITQKVDLDQAKEQVSKLRDQLEDMLTTWRQSFRPEKTAKVEAVTHAPETTAAKTTAANSTAANSTAAKKPAARATATSATKTSAAKTAKSSPAAKKSPAKSTAPKAKTS